MNGVVDIDDVFGSMPLEAMSKISFSNPHTSASDVIMVLTAVACFEGKSSEDFLSNDQRVFFDSILKQVLMDKEQEEIERAKTKQEDIEPTRSFAALFVAFCTGLSYLPYHEGNPDFKIIVEFNNHETTPDGLPVAHTCEKTLKLPGSTYGNNMDVFRSKLDAAIACTEGTFGMN